MSNNPNSVKVRKDDQDEEQKFSEIEEGQDGIIKKDTIPHFLPTYRIKFNYYSIPIVVVIILASILAYLTFFGAGVQVEESYFPEEDLGPLAVLLNGVIFTVIAVVSGFLIVFFIKKLGMGVLKYLFGISFGFVSFFITLMFLDVIIYLIFIQFPETTFVLRLYLLFTNLYIPIGTAISVFFLLYKYFTSKSIKTKNFIVLYISLLISASMSIVLPFWSTLAILVGISFWDIFAVLYKKGPIKEMIELISENDSKDEMEEAELKEQIESGNAIYDTTNLEIGIGDLAFYGLLTSSVLLFTNNIIIAALTTVAIVIGTGITISRLKKNRILPGLPISIFLGIGAFLLSQLIVTIFFI